ncbi:MAG TPA: diaminopimelate decarboxylase [Actinomycetota bacterium]|nr:diaminopimelate decarboxylase [Actinomycetota bacterium]
MHEVLPDTATISDSGRLQIGGLDAVELAERFGTPLIVLDRTTLETRAKSYSAALDPSRVVYAGKALCCVAICQIIDSLGLSLDVCSGGELETAAAAGFPMERVIFHGNNKSTHELETARDRGVGRIVVDSFDEIARLARVGVASKLLVRITPGVEAHTHEFVQTGQEDSKFGFTLSDGIALDALRRVNRVAPDSLVGIHAHIGSQIFELAAYDLAIKRLATFLAEAKADFGFEATELNLGGGLGIAHTHDEMTPDPSESVARMLAAVEREFRAVGLPVPGILVEPGRSLVGSSAVTLYRVGTVKKIPGVRTYVAVDGGMSDNIRPALYGARYEAFLADRMNAPQGPRVTVCGKHCESGDILIRDVHLPEDVSEGDLLCIPATGAYTYSMANTYNRVPRPPIVLVSEGRPTVIVERETATDLLRLDRRLDGSAL